MGASSAAIERRLSREQAIPGIAITEMALTREAHPASTRTPTAAMAHAPDGVELVLTPALAHDPVRR
jgi:hypothetical protein